MDESGTITAKPKTPEAGCRYRELKLESGERVMSYIVMLSGPSYEYSAMRIMTSMDAVHKIR